MNICKLAITIYVFVVVADVVVTSSASAQPGGVGRGQTLADVVSSYADSLSLPATSKLIKFPVPLVVDSQLNSQDWESQQRAILALTDDIPSAQPIFKATNRTTYSVYRTIINNRAAEDDPLTDAQRHTLRHAENILLYRPCLLEFWLWGRHIERTPSRKLLRYQQFEREDAIERSEYQRSGNQIKRAIITQRISATDDSWAKNGYKSEVESALQDFHRIVDETSQAFWTTVDDQYKFYSHTFAGGELPQTEIVPLSADWSKDDGWNSWTDGSSSAEFKVVDIKRPWLNEDAITTRRWEWSAGIYERERVVISDGNGFASTAPQDELMPLLPTALVLGRHFRFASGSSDEIVVVGEICRVLPREPPP